MLGHPDLLEVLLSLCLANLYKGLSPLLALPYY